MRAVAPYGVKAGCVCQGCPTEASWSDPENGASINGSRRKGPAASVVRFRGGSASTRETKGAIKEDTGWGLNLNVFGWGGDNEAKTKAKQEAEDAEARDALRKAREERYAHIGLITRYEYRWAGEIPFLEHCILHR